MIDNVMDIADVAAQVGVKPSSVKYYWKHDRMPPADVLFNGTPGWYQDTINAWRPKKAVVPAVIEDADFNDEPVFGMEEGRPVIYVQETLDWEEDDEYRGMILNYGEDESRGMADALSDLEEPDPDILHDEFSGAI